MKGLILRRSILDGLTVTNLLFISLSLALDPTESQLLDLKLLSTLFLVFILLGAIISYFLNLARIKTWGQSLFEGHLQNIKLESQKESAPWYRTFWGWQMIITLALLLGVGFVKSHFSIPALLDVDGFAGARRLFLGIFAPNWSVLPAAVLNIIETIFMAFLATALAVPFAFILCFLAARNVMTGKIAFTFYLVLRTLLNLTRAIEALIWAIIFSVWVGIGPFAGLLALMIHSIASLTKQYSEIVESAALGPIEGVESSGANKLQVIRYGIVPQVFLPFISFTVYRWDINVRMATIIGLVGGGGIGTMLIKYQGQGLWPEVGTIIVVIAAVVWIMDQASASIREALK